MVKVVVIFLLLIVALGLLAGPGFRKLVARLLGIKRGR